MALTRSTGALLGTDESTGVTIATTATTTGSVVDLLGDNTSVGEVILYLVFTSTVTAGTVDVKFNTHRVSGQTYSGTVFQRSFAPINGTRKIPLGTFKVGRYVNAEVKNNGTGANATNVAVLYELEKAS